MMLALLPWVSGFSAGNIRFQHAIDPDSPTSGIFHHEALAVVSALYWAIHNLPLWAGLCIAIYTDNSNTVDMFNTLCAQPMYNPLVMTAVNFALNFHIEFHVFHIPGEDSLIANAISHFHYDVLATFAPLLCILQF
jgi:hypothetical protein